MALGRAVSNAYFFYGFVILGYGIDGFSFFHNSDLDDIASVSITLLSASSGPYDGRRDRRSSRRERRSVANLPGELSFGFAVGDSKVVLNLLRNKQIERDIPLYLLRKGSSVRKNLHRSKDVFGFYQDVTHGAVIMVRKPQRRAENYELMGTYYVQNKQYAIQPVSVENQSHTKQSVNHTVARLNNNLDLRNDIIKISSPNASNLEMAAGRTKRQATNVAYTVELLMVTDYAVFKQWYSMTTGFDEEDRRANTYDVIRQYYAFVLNGIDLRYAGLKDNGISMDVTFAGIVIVDDPLESYWTEENVNKTNLVESSDALESFRAWILNNPNSLPANDHVMLFSGFNLTYGGSTSNAGLAYLGSMCNPEFSVSIVEEYFEFRVIAIASHELGHSLGSRHDMDGNNCYSFFLYIMTSRFRFPSKSKATNPWKFSSCSVSYFREYIDVLNRNETNCLLTKDSSTDSATIAGFLGDMPGEVYSPDEQCSLAVGNQSYVCRERYSKGFNNICSQGLSCYITGTTQSCTSIIPGDGTPCGSKRWCFAGKCEFSETAAKLDESCLMGDQPGIIAGGQNCSERVRGNPVDCYMTPFFLKCCASCTEVSSGIPGCEFGDQYSQCEAAKCPTYEKKFQTINCCSTCYNYFNPSTTTTTTMATTTTAVQEPTTTATLAVNVVTPAAGSGTGSTHGANSTGTDLGSVTMPSVSRPAPVTPVPQVVPTMQVQPVPRPGINPPYAYPPTWYIPPYRHVPNWNYLWPPLFPNGGYAPLPPHIPNGGYIPPLSFVPNIPLQPQFPDEGYMFPGPLHPNVGNPPMSQHFPPPHSKGRQANSHADVTVSPVFPNGGFQAPSPLNPNYGSVPPFLGYPNVPPSSGYPNIPPSSGYPNIPPSGYPNIPPSGYPNIPHSAYPNVPPSSGYPNIPPSSGYPNIPPSSGYPNIPPSSGYPNIPPSLGDPNRHHGPFADPTNWRYPQVPGLPRVEPVPPISPPNGHNFQQNPNPNLNNVPNSPQNPNNPNSSQDSNRPTQSPDQPNAGHLPNLQQTPNRSNIPSSHVNPRNGGLLSPQFPNQRHIPLSPYWQHFQRNYPRSLNSNNWHWWTHPDYPITRGVHPSLPVPNRGNNRHSQQVPNIHNGQTSHSPVQGRQNPLVANNTSHNPTHSQLPKGQPSVRTNPMARYNPQYPNQRPATPTGRLPNQRDNRRYAQRLPWYPRIAMNPRFPQRQTRGYRPPQWSTTGRLPPFLHRSVRTGYPFRRWYSQEVNSGGISEELGVWGQSRGNIPRRNTFAAATHGTDVANVQPLHNGQQQQSSFASNEWTSMEEDLKGDTGYAALFVEDSNAIKRDTAPTKGQTVTTHKIDNSGKVETTEARPIKKVDLKINNMEKGDNRKMVMGKDAKKRERGFSSRTEQDKQVSVDKMNTGFQERLVGLVKVPINDKETGIDVKQMEENLLNGSFKRTTISSQIQESRDLLHENSNQIQKDKLSTNRSKVKSITAETTSIDDSVLNPNHILKSGNTFRENNVKTDEAKSNMKSPTPVSRIDHYIERRMGMFTQRQESSESGSEEEDSNTRILHHVNNIDSVKTTHPTTASPNANTPKMDPDLVNVDIPKPQNDASHKGFDQTNTEKHGVETDYTEPESQMYVLVKDVKDEGPWIFHTAVQPFSAITDRIPPPVHRGPEHQWELFSGNNVQTRIKEQGKDAWSYHLERQEYRPGTELDNLLNDGEKNKGNVQHGWTEI